MYNSDKWLIAVHSLSVCRGFGFITFAKAETVDKVLKAHDVEPIYIDDKQARPSLFSLSLSLSPLLSFLSPSISISLSSLSSLSLSSFLSPPVLMFKGLKALCGRFRTVCDLGHPYLDFSGSNTFTVTYQAIWN